MAITMAVVGLGIYLSNQNSGEDGDRAIIPDRDAASEVEVIYSDSGYSPDLVRVKVGTTVIFKNESSRLMWTASDVHPTHEVLPAFDPARGARSGESYSFRFDTPGAWKYHNHLRAFDEGEVIVE